MGDDPGAQPTREQLEDQLREARRQEFDALATANRLYETASQAEAERAYAEHQARRDEIARLERELSAIDQPREDILEELGPESEHAAMLAGMGEGEGQTAEQAESETGRRNRRTLLALAASGSLLALAILAWMAWQQQQQAANASPSPTTAAQASPSGAPLPTAPSTPELATASPAPQTPTPLPLTQRPASGSSTGIASFARTSGTCPIAHEFTAEFALEAIDGDVVLTQLPVNHVTTGTLTRTGPSSGLLQASAQGQRYEATIAGNLVSGSHLYTASGCNDAYDFRMVLDRPLLAPSPFGEASARFKFLDTDGRELIDITATPVVVRRVVLASRDDLDLSGHLPIQVNLHVGDETPWESRVESDPPTPAPIPPVVLESLLTGPQPVLIATGSGGDVLAVYAPRDINWELTWVAELLTRH